MTGPAPGFTITGVPFTATNTTTIIAATTTTNSASTAVNANAKASSNNKHTVLFLQSIPDISLIFSSVLLCLSCHAAEVSYANTQYANTKL